MNIMYMMRGFKKIKKTKSRILVSPPHEEEKTQINKERKTKCGLGSENENHVSDFLFMLIQGST
jgi:uncharacterized ion transporter superfamily protein YfcC